MAYLGTQPNDIRKNIGLYTPSEILQLTKDGNWGGSLEFIKQVDVSSANALVVTEIKEDLYDVHYFTFTLTGDHQDHTLFINFSEDGGSSYVTSNYAYSKSYGQTNGTFNQATNNGTSYIQLAQSVDSNLGCNNYGYFYFLGNASRRSYYSGVSVFERSGDSGVKRFEFGGGDQKENKLINAIKFYPNVGNMTGTLKIYGVKQ